MIYRYLIKDKTETDIAGLNNEFKKFKNEKECKSFEDIEKYFMAFVKQHKLKYEAFERFGDDGGVYFVYINEGEFIYIQKLDSNNEPGLELIQDRLLTTSRNTEDKKREEREEELKQEKSKQEELKQEELKQEEIQQNIHQKYLMELNYDNEWDCEI